MKISVCSRRVILFIIEHVYSHKAAQKKEKKNSTKNQLIQPIAYIYIKQVVQQINS